MTETQAGFPFKYIASLSQNKNKIFRNSFVSIHYCYANIRSKFIKISSRWCNISSRGYLSQQRKTQQLNQLKSIHLICFHCTYSHLPFVNRAATNNYFHYRLICQLFIIYSVKCQRSVKNAHLKFPALNVTLQIASFVQTAAQNTKTHLLS